MTFETNESFWIDENAQYKDVIASDCYRRWNYSLYKWLECRQWHSEDTSCWTEYNYMAFEMNESFWNDENAQYKRNVKANGSYGHKKLLAL